MATEKELLREQLEFFLQKLKEAGPLDLPSLLDGVVRIMGELHKLEANEKFQSPSESFQDVEEDRYYAVGEREPVEIEYTSKSIVLDTKIQSIVDTLPNSEWQLRRLVDDDMLTIPHYRRLVTAMAARIQTYAREEIFRVEYRWRTRAWKMGIALSLAIPVLVVVICFAVQHL